MDHQTHRSSPVQGEAPEATAGRVTATPDPHEAPTESLKSAVSQFAELREYASYLLAAKTDAWKLSIKRMGILAAVGAIALLAGGATVVTAAVLLCLGIALGLGRLMNGHYWAGYLIVGGVLLLLVGGGAFWFASRTFKSSRKATVKKYELRRTQQRAEFGHDVNQRAGKSL